MRQCTEVETKKEWDKSWKVLNLFLSLKETTDVLSSSCIEKVREFSLKLQTKESRLANYHRVFITNSMDAATTSPVEAMNSTIKSGDEGVNSNMNLSNTLSSAISSTSKRIERRDNQAHRDLVMSSYSSRAPTKDEINMKGQGLLDASYDSRIHFKGEQGEIFSDVGARNFPISDHPNSDIGMAEAVPISESLFL